MSNTDSMKIKSFEPNTYIEISDTMKGFRKLALVTPGGDMYYDLANNEASPFPIYEALNPQAAGNALSWGAELATTKPQSYQLFVGLHKHLLIAEIDSITLNRALYWAYKNDSYDYSRALAAGKAATDEVLQSRAMMDGLIYKAAVA